VNSFRMAPITRSSQQQRRRRSPRLLASESSNNSIDEPIPQNHPLTRVDTMQMDLAEQGNDEELISRDDQLSRQAPSRMSSSYSVSTVDDMMMTDDFNEEAEQQDEEPCLSKDDLAVDKYMAKREMTPVQERMNALTVVPTFIYCFYFLLSGAWLDQDAIDEAREEFGNGEKLFVDVDPDMMCISSNIFPNLHSLPPLPVVAAAAGIVMHAPFSFIYHWTYAHRLPAGIVKMNHWSRRMDQAMIHVISAAWAYATSGNLYYFIANLMFNLDCICRQFDPKVRPRRNQTRIAISCIAYMIPYFNRGEILLLIQLGAIYGLSGWLFAAYPIGGWSHSAFHLVIALAPPLVFAAALQLPTSQHRIQIAAQCAIRQEMATI
jgi:hypothetical protein